MARSNSLDAAVPVIGEPHRKTHQTTDRCGQGFLMQRSPPGEHLGSGGVVAGPGVLAERETANSSTAGTPAAADHQPFASFTTSSTEKLKDPGMLSTAWSTRARGPRRNSRSMKRNRDQSPSGEFEAHLRTEKTSDCGERRCFGEGNLLY